MLKQLEKVGAAKGVLPDDAVFADLVQIHGFNALADRGFRGVGSCCCNQVMQVAAVDELLQGIAVSLGG